MDANTAPSSYESFPPYPDSEDSGVESSDDPLPPPILNSPRQSTSLTTPPSPSAPLEPTEVESPGTPSSPILKSASKRKVLVTTCSVPPESLASESSDRPESPVPESVNQANSPPASLFDPPETPGGETPPASQSPLLQSSRKPTVPPTSPPAPPQAPPPIPQDASPPFRSSSLYSIPGDWPDSVNDAIFAEAYNNILARIAPCPGHPLRTFLIHHWLRANRVSEGYVAPWDDLRPTTIRWRYRNLAAQDELSSASSSAASSPVASRCPSPNRPGVLCSPRTERRPTWHRPRAPRLLVARGVTATQENIIQVLCAAGQSGHRHFRDLDCRKPAAERFYMKGLLSCLPFTEKLQLELGTWPLHNNGERDVVDPRDRFENSMRRQDDREYWLSTLKAMHCWLEEVLVNEHPVLDRKHIQQAQALKTRVRKLYGEVREHDPGLKSRPMPDFMLERECDDCVHGDGTVQAVQAAPEPQPGRLAAVGRWFAGWFTATEADRRDNMRWWAEVG